MNLDQAVFAFTGAAVLASLALGYFVSPWFFMLTGFVGLNQLLASTAGTCLSAGIFRRLGLKPGAALR